MKKFIVAAIAISIMLIGCTNETNVIGISKIVDHPALNAVEQGIQDQLAEMGFEMTYDLQNANGDPNASQTIASKFKANNVAVAVGIATPTAQALVSSIEDIPVVFAAVTDPIDAGLVDTLGGSGTNVTGISDMTPVKAQIQFLSNIVEVKKLGHIYTSSEQNAVVLAELAEQACNELGIEFVGVTVEKSADVKQAAVLLVDQVDAIYLSTDNNVISALAAIVEVATDAGVPIMSADPSSAETNGVLAAWGFDYYKMGRATGRMIAKILDGADPGTISTGFMTDPTDTTLLINLDVAEQLGISIAPSVKADASIIIEDGNVTEM